jgi:hypothetical protein
MSAEFLVKIIGLFLGVLARTALPWLRKVRDGKVRGFSRRYFYSGLAALTVGLILTLTIFPRFEAGPAGAGFEAFFKLFALAFAFGFGWNALINEGGAWVEPGEGLEPGPAARGRASR